MGNLTVTVDGVPDGARLSAGQFLGDGTWSVPAGDLDGLALHPSPGRNRSCRLSIRLRKIDKDMGDAFSIGAVYIDVDGDAGHAAIAGADGAISLRRKGGEGDTPPSQMAAPKPARRIVRVTAANPSGASRSPNAQDSATDGGDGDHGGSTSPGTVGTAPAPFETPIRTVATPDPTDLGIAPPAPIDDVAARQGALARADETGIVPVHVAAGLRIEKFGKTGRPEEVVSVRGRAGAVPARRERNGSIVFVSRRSGDPPPA